MMPSKEVAELAPFGSFRPAGYPEIFGWTAVLSWCDRRDAGPTRIGGPLRSGPDPKIPRVHPAGGLRAIWLVGGRGAG